MIDPAMPDPATIARTLTPAQVRAMRMIVPDQWNKSLKTRLSQRSCRPLEALGLLHSRTFQTKWRLTDLGVRVRDGLD